MCRNVIGNAHLFYIVGNEEKVDNPANSEHAQSNHPKQSFQRSAQIEMLQMKKYRIIRSVHESIPNTTKANVHVLLVNL